MGSTNIYPNKHIMFTFKAETHFNIHPASYPGPEKMLRWRQLNVNSVNQYKGYNQEWQTNRYGNAYWHSWML